MEIPARINKDIIVYSLPLFLITLTRSNDNDKYWESIIGAFIALVPMKSKRKLILSSLLYIVQLFVPFLHFYVLGFIIHQAYNSRILLSQRTETAKVVAKIETIALLCSTLIKIPAIFNVAMGSIAVFLAFTCDPPSVECSDPFENMKERIDSAGLLNLEYRTVLKNQSWRDDYAISNSFILETFFMISKKETLVLFCLYFSFNISELFLILTGIIFIFNGPWELSCILIKVNPTRNGFFRCLMTYFWHYLLNIVHSITNPEIIK